MAGKSQQLDTIENLPVKNIKEGIEFQSDSTIIKMILKKNNGNIVLFAFDKEQGLIEHAASSDALVFIIEGEIEFTISNGKYLLKEGDTLTLPSKIPHSLFAIKQTKMLLVVISD
jgi:quercetin dioxygenase-like cupin family protein